MKLPTYLLDQWLTAHDSESSAIRFNLGGSTGPLWTLRELLALGGDLTLESLSSLPLSYAPAGGSRALRESIANLYGIDPDWVVVTTGASEALSSVIGLYAQPGVSITLPFPAFPAIPVMAMAFGMDIRRYELRRESGYTQTCDAVMAAVTADTRLVLVNTPHNPTGSVMETAETKRLAAHLEERGIPLVVDEVYHPLYFDSPVRSAIELENTIVISDLSKAFSLSGARVGWIIDRDPVRRQQFIERRAYFTNSGSPLTEAIAAHALQHADAILGRLRTVVAANLSTLRQFMHQHQQTLGWIPPRGGTVVFPWLHNGCAARLGAENLSRRGVLITPGDCFDAPEHFRLGIGSQVHGFDAALDLLSQELAEAGGFTLSNRSPGTCN